MPVLAPAGEILFATKTIPGFRPAGQPIGCSNSLQANLCSAKEKSAKERPPGCRLSPAFIVPMLLRWNGNSAYYGPAGSHLQSRTASFGVSDLFKEGLGLGAKVQVIM